jgi:hypothetical protein
MVFNNFLFMEARMFDSVIMREMLRYFDSQAVLFPLFYSEKSHDIVVFLNSSAAVRITLLKPASKRRYKNHDTPPCIVLLEASTNFILGLHRINRRTHQRYFVSFGGRSLSACRPMQGVQARLRHAAS